MRSEATPTFSGSCWWSISRRSPGQPDLQHSLHPEYEPTVHLPVAEGRYLVWKNSTRPRTVSSWLQQGGLLYVYYLSQGDTLPEQLRLSSQRLVNEIYGLVFIYCRDSESGRYLFFFWKADWCITLYQQIIHIAEVATYNWNQGKIIGNLFFATWISKFRIYTTWGIFKDEIGTL